MQEQSVPVWPRIVVQSHGVHPARPAPPRLRLHSTLTVERWPAEGAARLSGRPNSPSLALPLSPRCTQLFPPLPLCAPPEGLYRSVTSCVYTINSSARRSPSRSTVAVLCARINTQHRIAYQTPLPDYL